MYKKRLLAMMFLSTLLILFSLCEAASAWGAEWHFPWTYLFAMENGYGHEASYLLGQINYNFDFGDKSSVPLIGSPEYHYDYGFEASRTGMRRSELPGYHLVRSWECAFKGDDEGFYYNTAAALHPLQDDDAHADESTFSHLIHVVLGTIFYGDGWLFSWLDDPYSEDVYTRKIDRYPAELSSRAKNSLRNTDYVLRIQVPLRKLAMSDYRIETIEDLLRQWATEASGFLGIEGEEALMIADIAAEAARDAFGEPVSPVRSDFPFEEIAMGKGEARGADAWGAGSGAATGAGAIEGLPIPAMNGAVHTGSYAGFLKENLASAIGDLFAFGDKWAEEIGRVSADDPKAPMDLIKRVFVKAAAGAIAKSARQEEAFLLRALKQDGPAKAHPAD